MTTTTSGTTGTTTTAGTSTLAAIGCYTDVSGGPTGAGRGVVLARLGVDGAPSTVVTQIAGHSPSFVAWAENGRHLHAVHETNPGQITTYAVDTDNHSLRVVSTAPSGGDRPCHIAVRPGDGALVIANYADGPVTQLTSHPALSQAHPWTAPATHPHHTLFTTDGGQLLTCDIGRDEVQLYTAGDPPLRQAVLAMPAGSGPRHAAWLDNHHVAVVGEHDATVTIVRVDATTLSLIRTLPSTTHGPRSWPSEVTVTPIGDTRYLVVGHRRPGHLSLHRITDPAEGRLDLEREHPLPTDNARHLAVDPATGVAWVALQDDDRLVAIDLLHGQVRGELRTGAPSCVALAPPSRRHP